MYITRFSENGFKALASFDDDVDVRTGGNGVGISADSLSSWKEAPIPIRSRNSDLGTNAVWLGWNNKPAAGSDTTKPRSPASYSITISDSLHSAWGVNEGSSVVLSLAPTTATPGPRKTATDTTKKADSSKAKPSARTAAKKPEPKKAAPDTMPVDLTIELVDASGGTARAPLSQFGKPRKPLEITVYRRKNRDKNAFPATHEMVLQTYVMPFKEFARGSGSFDPARVRTIRLLFDRTQVGQVVVDDIGFSAIDPAYLAQRN
jgi:hypothetical protein